MEILNYFFVSLAVFAGLIIGWIVGRIAKEELKPGKKYLALLEKLLLCAVFLIAIVLVVNSIWLSILLLGALIYLITFSRFRDIMVYGFFGVIFYLSIERWFLLQAALMFAYGFPAGSMHKSLKDIFARCIWIVPVAIVLFLVV